MAPLEVIDSVVLHELVHLKIKNHSKSFWMKFKQMQPSYDLHKKWLSENGFLMKI